MHSGGCKQVQPSRRVIGKSQRNVLQKRIKHVLSAQAAHAQRLMKSMWSASKPQRCCSRRVRHLKRHCDWQARRGHVRRSARLPQGVVPPLIYRADILAPSTGIGRDANVAADRRFRRAHAGNGRARHNPRPNLGAYNWIWDPRAHDYVWAQGRKDRNKLVHSIHGNMPSRCVGAVADGAPCVFEAQVPRRGDRCVLCDPEALAAACLAPLRRRMVLARLKKVGEGLQAEAIARVPAEYHGYFTQRLAEQARWCAGLPGEPCSFAVSARGGRVQVMGRRRRCLFCDPEALAARCGTDGGRRQVLASLRKMGVESRRKAIDERVPEAARAHFAAVCGGAAPREGLRRRSAGHAKAKALPQVRRRPAADVDEV